MKIIFTLVCSVLIYNLFSQQVLNEEAKFNTNVQNKSISDTTKNLTFSEGNICYGTDKLGHIVKSAGDVNGDGFEDVLVGYSGQTGKGFVNLYFGGTQLSDTADLVFYYPGTSFGNSLAGVGDVNNDGYDDIIIGMYQYQSNRGAAFLYLGGPNMDNQSDLTIIGLSTGSNFGYDITPVGDINADGFDDFAIGAFGHATLGGDVLIYYGSTTPDATWDFFLSAGAVNHFFGQSLAYGYLNDDIYPDIIVGAPSNVYHNGRAYAFFGGPGMDNVPDVTIVGTALNSFFASEVACGDLNNDGFDDMIIGENKNNDYGKAYVNIGGASMDNTIDITITSNYLQTGFGRALSCGDFNHDGAVDLAIGSIDLSWPEDDPGNTYIYYGGGATQTGQRIIGTTNSRLGAAVAMNGTGSIIAVGAPYTYTQTAKSFVQVYDVIGDTLIQKGNTLTAPNFFDMMGSALSLSNDGNILAIGFPANEFCALPNGRVLIYQWDGTTWNQKGNTLSGNASRDLFGCSLELTPDGSRIVIGAKENDSNGSNSGVTKVFEWNGTSWIQVGSNIPGEAANNLSGGAVSISSDGNTIAIGAESNTGGGTFSGHCRIYSWDGSAWIQKGTDIDGLPNDKSGNSVHINNNGTRVVIGAYNSSLYGTLAGAARVFDWNGSSWQQMGNNISLSEANSKFGTTVLITDDGNTLAIGASSSTSNLYGKIIKYGWNGTDWVKQTEVWGAGNQGIFGNAASISTDATKVIAGAPFYNSNTGFAEVYDWTSLGFDEVADLNFPGMLTGQLFGSAVCLDIDYNNDGANDLFVGVPEYETETFYGNTGAFFVYNGSAAADTIRDYFDVGRGRQNRFGEDLSISGDLNNDGYNDMVILGNGYKYFKGELYIYYGSANPDSIVDKRISGELNNLGNTVDVADINNDGYDDIICSGKGTNYNPIKIFLGGPTINNVPDIEIPKPFYYTNSWFNNPITAGDLNNDGYNDIILQGAKNNDSGYVYLYYGGPTIDTVPSLTFYGNLLKQFGASKAGAGDVNGDGFDDLMIGEYLSDKVYLYYGGTNMDNIADKIFTGTQTGSDFGFSIDGAGDLNLDGYDDIVIGSPKLGTNSQGGINIFRGGPNMSTTAFQSGGGSLFNERVGEFVYGGADLNDDGFPDIISGSQSFQNSRGKVVVFLTQDYPSIYIDTSSVYAINMHGFESNSNFGCHVSAGDVNGDGVNDIMIGAYWSPAYNTNGAAHLYFGVPDVKFVTQPVGQTVCLGDTVMFIATTDIPATAYMWKRVNNLGQVSNLSNNTIISGVTNDTLIISGVTALYADKSYICYARGHIAYQNNYYASSHTAYLGLHTENYVPDVTILPDITGECYAEVLSVPTATSTCGNNISGVTNDPYYYNAFGTYQVNWMYITAQNDTIYQTQNVIVLDTTPPLPDITNLPDITEQCSATVTAPSGWDNCMGSITATTQDPLTYDMNGNYIVSWNYDDGNGNILTQSQNIFIQDITNPVIVCNSMLNVNADQTNTYTVNGNELDPVSTSDNCQVGNLTNDINLGSTLAGEIFPTGISTIVWTLTDETGNISTCTTTVNVDQYVGMNEIASSPISIFPNPTKGLITIKGNDIEFVQIDDMKGRAIPFEVNDKNTLQIDFYGLSKGVYVVKVITKLQQKVEKVVYY